MSLTIQKDHWVKLQYRVTDTMGAEVEVGFRELTYLHGGYGMLFPKLEELLLGKKVGDELTTQLEPEDHFGDYEAQLLHLVDRHLLPSELQEGMTFEGMPGEPNDGEIYTVTDITEEKVVLDGNHPLAGMALRFTISVIEVKLATAEQIQREQAQMLETQEFDASPQRSAGRLLH